MKDQGTKHQQLQPLERPLSASLAESEAEKDILLSLSSEIACIRDKQELEPILKKQLKALGFYDDLGIIVMDEKRKEFRPFLLNSSSRQNHPGYKTISTGAHPYPDGFFEIAMEAKGPSQFHLEDVVKSKTVPLYIRILYDAGIRETMSIVMRDRGRDIGGLFLHSSERKTYNDRQLQLLQGIANQVGTAVAKILATEEITERERDNSMLLSLSRDITSCKTKEDVQRVIEDRLARYFHFHEIVICLKSYEDLRHTCYMHMSSFEAEKDSGFDGEIMVAHFAGDGIFNAIEASDGPVIFDLEELVMRTNKAFYLDFWHRNKVREIIGFPLRMNDVYIGAVTLYPTSRRNFSNAELTLVQAVCSNIGIALSNIITYEKMQLQLEEINRYKYRLEEENLYLQEQLRKSNENNEVIGANGGLKMVFELVASVAPSDTAVLLLGETGTGKELIARAIHETSSRKEKTMIKVNCAALPAQLIESELFGHEKGSFTGAMERRIGKFELADRSTLFLDEIGEMSAELQVKLLRVLQEREIERVGGQEIIKTDVRIIVATNRDLQKEVEAGRFRSDLFYRVNVFPILIPPLRERKEDIPILVSHFIKKVTRNTGKKIVNVGPAAIKGMTAHNWPGNVRELEHVIERSVLMTKGETLEVLMLTSIDKKAAADPVEVAIKSLAQNERDYILATLRKSKGRVRGANGAAALLKIPPTTLHSKMKKLGIRKTGF